MLKIDLGSGPPELKRTDSTWLAVDRWANGVDIRCDMGELPFADNTVDAIWSSHSLEHITFKEVPALLQEWFRVLKPEGTLTILVPDFDFAAQYWTANAGHPDREVREACLRLIFSTQRTPVDFHYAAWNEKSLQIDLEDVGFKVDEIKTYWTEEYGQFSVRAEVSKP